VGASGNVDPLQWYWWDIEAWLRRLRRCVIIGIAWRVPKPIAYWVFIRMAARGEAHWSCMDVLELHKGWYHE
jgi:hypothetical protein